MQQAAAIKAMNPRRERGPFSDGLRLIGASSAVAIILVSVGWVPTLRLTGQVGVPAMLVGIGLSWAASCIASLPLAISRGKGPADRTIAALGSMALRMFATLALFLTVALCQWVALKPLAIWTGISYLVQVAAETIVAVRLLRRREAGTA